MHAGLDARAAAIVMRTVRNIVNTGRTIVCTIHQPSIDIFEAFDELLLLKRGGECIFNGQLGKDSSRLIDYFSVSVSQSMYISVLGTHQGSQRASTGNKINRALMFKVFDNRAPWPYGIEVWTVSSCLTYAFAEGCSVCIMMTYHWLAYDLQWSVISWVQMLATLSIAAWRLNY